MKKIVIRIVLVSVFLLSSGIVQADVLHYDDVIITGSNCVGFDCVNGESFGFDTIRLKENNLRIKFQDTSTSASFPTNDWQITANDSSNGGAEKFSIDDIDHGRTPFTIEAGAPSHSLYVDDSGRLGLGTSTPVADVHVKSGNTPTVRLEQDGSSGFTPQTWDVAGNEANFFIRDATGGSTLPFRIFPGAPSNAICIEAGGDVGLGTTSPDAPFHVYTSSTGAVDSIYLENTQGPARIVLENGAKTDLSGSSEASKWVINSNGSLRLSAFGGSPTTEFELDALGNLTLTGSLTTATNTYPDYVFEDNYPLMSLTDLNDFIEKEGHLPNMTSADEVKKAGGVNMSDLQIKLLEKVEELTLYTLQQQAMIDTLKKEIQTLKQ